MDITRNQASNSLAAKETELQVEKEVEAESVQNDVHQTPANIWILKTAAKMRVAMERAKAVRQ